MRKVCFDVCTAGRRLVEVRRLSFNRRKACSMLLEVRVKHHKAYIEVGIVRFEHCKACRRLVVVGRVGFDHRKACRMLLEVGESVLSTAKPVGGM